MAFDADSDMRMYRLMTAWKANDGIDFDFNNAHELTTIREDSGEEAIKRSLRERMKNSKIFVLLVGEETKNLRKYVPWEIDLALEADLPVVVVNLNKTRGFDSQLCPTKLHKELGIHIPFGINIMQHALDNWPQQHAAHRSQEETGPYKYGQSVYDSIEAD